VAQQRLTTDQAARVLGVTVDAVRKRAERGELPYEKEGNRLYILLDDVSTQSGTDVEGSSQVLISQMQARIDSLGWQLEQAIERDRETRRIVAALTQRIPELPRAQALSSRPESQEPPEPVMEATATEEAATEEAARAKLLEFLQVLLSVVAAGTLPVVLASVAIALVYAQQRPNADPSLVSPMYVYLGFQLFPLFCGLYAGLTWKGIHLRGHLLLGMLAGVIETVMIGIFQIPQALAAFNRLLADIGGTRLSFDLTVSDIIAVFATIMLFMAGGIFGDLLEQTQSPRKKAPVAWASLLVPGTVTGTFGLLANIVASGIKF